MRLFLIIALICSLAPEARAETLSHAGVERSYLLHVPPSVQGPRPVFVVLHPGGSYAAQFRRMTRFDAEADAAGAIAVYPQGVSGHWNDGRTSEDGSAVHSGDDTGFILALIDRLVEEGLADRTKVHVAGHSNGGMMAMRLSCEAPERLRSIAAVSASLPVGFSCPRQVHPIAALFIRGTSDPYVPIAGGRVKGEHRRGSVLSAEATLGFFARRNGCTSPGSKRVPAPASGNGMPATVTTYRRCEGAPTVGVALEGGGHGWPGFRYSPRMTRMIGPTARSFSATKAIARFFLTREAP